MKNTWKLKNLRIGNLLRFSIAVLMLGCSTVELMMVGYRAESMLNSGIDYISLGEFFDLINC